MLEVIVMFIISSVFFLFSGRRVNRWTDGIDVDFKKILHEAGEEEQVADNGRVFELVYSLVF